MRYNEAEELTRPALEEQVPITPSSLQDLLSHRNASGMQHSPRTVKFDNTLYSQNTATFGSDCILIIHVGSSHLPSGRAGSKSLCICKVLSTRSVMSEHQSVTFLTGN